jgi:hypothetical protein
MSQAGIWVLFFGMLLWPFVGAKFMSLTRDPSAALLASAA